MNDLTVLKKFEMGSGSQEPVFPGKEKKRIFLVSWIPDFKSESFENRKVISTPSTNAS